jgi:hypothetical protein
MRRRKAFQIKRPGALTAQQNPGETMAQTANRVSATGTPLEKKQANFYRNVLAPANAKRRRRGRKG